MIARVKSWWWRVKQWFRPRAVWTGAARNGRPMDPDNWRQGRLPCENGIADFPAGACYNPPVRLDSAQDVNAHAIYCGNGSVICLPMVTDVTSTQTSGEAPRDDASGERDR